MSEQPPWTDETLRILVANIPEEPFISPYFRRPNEEPIELSVAQTKELMRALSPIESVDPDFDENWLHPTEPADWAAEFGFQISRDPVVVRVAVRDTELEYKSDGRTYHGGNAKKFMRILENIRSPEK